MSSGRVGVEYSQEVATNTSSIDPSRCPLCADDNGCAMAGSDPTDPCWCTSASIPPSLLALVPPELQSKACICKTCVEAHLPSGDAPR